MHLLLIPTSSLITSIRSTGLVEKNMTSSPVDRTIVGNVSTNNEFKTILGHSLIVAILAANGDSVLLLAFLFGSLFYWALKLARFNSDDDQHAVVKKSSRILALPSISYPYTFTTISYLTALTNRDTQSDLISCFSNS